MSLTRIKSRWTGGMLEFRDEVTGETVNAYAPVKLFDDFTGLAIDNTNDWTVAGVNSGTATVTAAIGGHMRLTTGGADDDDIDVASSLTWEASKFCVCEARIAMNDVAATAFCFGFADATGYAADQIAVTYNGTTLTSNAGDCAMWFMDSEGTSDMFRCAAVNNTTAGTVTAVPLATATPTNAVFHTFRVQINSAGDCAFFFDGEHIYTQLLGITTTDDLCVYVGFMNHEIAANTLDVDYIKAWQLR